MDGLISLGLLAVPSQGLLSGLADLAVLATSMLLTMFSGLALVRQLIAAMTLGP
jgi:hypothetical protein